MRFIHAKFTAWREHRVLPHQATAATIRRGEPLAVARSLIQNTFTTRRRLELSTSTSRVTRLLSSTVLSMVYTQPDGRWKKPLEQTKPEFYEYSGCLILSHTLLLQSSLESSSMLMPMFHHFRIPSQLLLPFRQVLH